MLCDSGYGGWRNRVSAFSCVKPFSPRANWSHRVGSTSQMKAHAWITMRLSFPVFQSILFAQHFDTFSASRAVVDASRRTHLM